MSGSYLKLIEPERFRGLDFIIVELKLYLEYAATPTWLRTAAHSKIRE